MAGNRFGTAVCLLGMVAGLFAVCGEGAARPVRAAEGDPIWRPMNGSGLPPVGALNIWVIVAHPTQTGVVFAGTSPSYGQYGGVYRTTNGGLTWEAVNDGLPSGASIDMMAITPDGGMLYAHSASYQGGGFFRAPTGSIHWTKLGNPPVDNVEGLFSIYATSSAIFVGMYASGIYKSTDQGDTWKHLDHSPQNTINVIVGVATDANIMYAASAGVYQSVDAGEHWDYVPTNPESCNSGYTVAIAVDPAATDTVFAGDDNTCLQRSTDGGATWKMVYENVGVNHVVLDPLDHNIVYLTGIDFGLYHDGVMQSTDNGQTWNDYNDGLPYPAVRGFSLGPGAAGKPSVLYAGTSLHGIYTTAPVIFSNWVYLPMVKR